ncbi:glycosyltransferase [Trichothermofontia sp.]
MNLPTCSLIVVNYNGAHYLKDLFVSLHALDYPADLLELILVDNGSQDDSLALVATAFPQAQVIRNPVNSFTKALNLGIQAAQGDYIGFLNNDATVDRAWLRFLVEGLEQQPTVGAISGKLLFPDGRINSVGVEEKDNFYWADRGFGEVDQGQYDTPGEVTALCWAAILFRRTCLAQVGPIDEDFVMYMEDIDYARRCRDRGWSLYYLPPAIAYHQFRGSSQGNTLAEYFCNRNRFLYLAKHEPQALAQAIATSVFFTEHQYDLLHETVPAMLKKLFEHQDPETLTQVLPKLQELLIILYGVDSTDHLLQRLEVLLGYRKPRLGIYDHGLHFIGGGQNYVATAAAAIQDLFDITFIANKPVTIAQLEEWYGLDLSRCQVKVVPLPFYEQRGAHHIDSGLANDLPENPFDAIAAESRNYDLFGNANMLEKVKPLSPLSVFFCHFPDTQRGPYFAVDDYTFILTNSEFTSKWLRKRWGLEPTFLLYPPVEMGTATPENPPQKEKIILSVGRLEPGGNKKQLEMIQAFQDLVRAHPAALARWEFWVVGGSTPGNPYLEKVKALIKQGNAPIVVKTNVPRPELQAIYAKASIFWHACGLGEINPQLYEHFGMATVEAMQSFCVPIVTDGGGQQEIVEQGVSGLRFNSIAQMQAQTLELVTDPDRLKTMQRAAYDRSQRFRKAPFNAKVREFFEFVCQEYTQIHLPDPQAVVHKLRPS